LSRESASVRDVLGWRSSSFHSHPGEHAPHFSATDAEGEDHLARFMKRRGHGNVPHAALVMSRGGARGRVLGEWEEIRVTAIGPTRRVVFEPGAVTTSWPADVFDRQVRVFGAAAQQTLQALRVAIVGLGGTGSIVAQHLVHLGVRDLLLIDPDTIELSNLNRVANATPRHVGEPKVDVAAQYVRAVAPNARVDTLRADIISASTARSLRDVDLIFGCTDSHGSRAVLQQVAYQFLIPCIDMGTTIAVVKDQITHIYGRVQLLAPGLACFTCGGLLDSNEVRRDMMTPFERQADPYISGAREPAPAVMSLNGTVASLAVTMLLAFVAGVPSDARHVLYDARRSALRNIRAERDPRCFVCSPFGALARGEAWPLLTRQD